MHIIKTVKNIYLLDVIATLRRKFYILITINKRNFFLKKN